jgi:hypothetical protein
MNEDLYRLVYYSRNRVFGAPGSNALAKAIGSILRASRVNNARVGATGALLFNLGCFAQVLEGPRVAIENIFERVKLDPRHGDVSVLIFEPAPARAFEGWAMGFVGSYATDAALNQDSGFDPARTAGEALFEILHGHSLKEKGPLVR